MPPNTTQPLHTAPISELAVLLLKQFKRLLAEQGLNLTNEHLETLGERCATYQPDERIQPILDRLAERVAESETELLTRFNRTFEQALATDMTHIGGWQTTAEFLELANYKSNAELRISAGATLMMLFGDGRYSVHLWAVIRQDAGVWDVDASLAKRALCHAYRVDALADDWQDQVKKAQS